MTDVPQLPIQGPNTLLMGPPGVGKTFAITTLLKAGLKVAVLITDPLGEESLVDACERTKVPIDNLHWHYIPPAAPDWKTLQQMAHQIATRSFRDLADNKTGINKTDYQQLYEAIGVLRDFKCQRTDVELGPIDELDTSWAFVIDSLSGINTMCLRTTIGAKPSAHQGEWGVAMNAEEMLLDKLTGDLKCFFVLTAHVEKEHDEITGGTHLTVSMLGRKLAPKIPRNFSDVILAKRDGDKFFWSTTAHGVDLKTRTLALSDKLEPSFEPIVERWRQRNTQATTA